MVSDVSGNVPLNDRPAGEQYTGLYGFYLNFAQQLTRNASLDPKGGLNAFVNFSIADQQTSATWLQVAGGLIYTGPFASRPHDQISFAAGTTQVNPRLVGAQNTLSGLGLQPAVVRYSEYVFELQYGLVPVPGLTIRPNIQYVYRPARSPRTSTSLSSASRP